MAMKSAGLRSVRVNLDSFPAEQAQSFPCGVMLACLTLLHRYVNIRTVISLICLPVGKIYIGVFVSRVEVIDRPEAFKSCAIFIASANTVWMKIPNRWRRLRWISKCLRQEVNMAYFKKDKSDSICAFDR